MDANLGEGRKLPWRGQEERIPIADAGDADFPFVIRDAEGKVVLTIWEEYGPKLQERHTELGQQIVKAVNASLEKADST